MEPSTGDRRMYYNKSAALHYFRPWETLGIKVGGVHMKVPSSGHCGWAFDQHTCSQVRELKTILCVNSYPTWIHLPLTQRNVNKEKKWGRPTAFSSERERGSSSWVQKGKAFLQKMTDFENKKKIIKNWWLSGKNIGLTHETKQRSSKEGFFPP